MKRLQVIYFYYSCTKSLLNYVIIATKISKLKSKAKLTINKLQDMNTTSKTRKGTQKFKIKKIAKKKNGIIIHSGIVPLNKKKFPNLLIILTMIRLTDRVKIIVIWMVKKMTRKALQKFWRKKKLMKPCRFRIILILFWSKHSIYLMWTIMMSIVMHSSYTEKWTMFLQRYR